MCQFKSDRILLAHELDGRYLRHIVGPVNVAPVAPIRHGLETIRHPKLAQLGYGQVEAPGPVWSARDGNVSTRRIFETPLGMVQHLVVQFIERPVKHRIEIVHGNDICFAAPVACSSGSLDAPALSRQDAFLSSISAILIGMRLFERGHGIPTDLGQSLVTPHAAGIARVEEYREGAPREGTEEVVHGLVWLGLAWPRFGTSVARRGRGVQSYVVTETESGKPQCRSVAKMRSIAGMPCSVGEAIAHMMYTVQIALQIL